MKKYIGQLQAKIYSIEIMMERAKRDNDWEVYEFAADILDEANFELKQAEWMEANK